MTSPTDKRGGGQGSSASFSEEKETMDRAALLSLASSALPISLIPQFCSFVSYSLIWIRTIMASPKDRRERGQGPPPSSSWKGRRRTVRRSSPLHCPHCHFSCPSVLILPPLLPWLYPFPSVRSVYYYVA